MYQALYRKYRPNNFSDVTGQEIIIKTLNYEFTYIVKDVYKVEGFIGKDEDDIYFIPQKVC